MSKRNDWLLTEDMHLACKRILSYTNNLDYQQFLEDEKTLGSIVRNIQILGEAAKQVSEEMQDKHEGIE